MLHLQVTQYPQRGRKDRSAALNWLFRISQQIAQAVVVEYTKRVSISKQIPIRKSSSVPGTCVKPPAGSQYLVSPGRVSRCLFSQRHLAEMKAAEPGSRLSEGDSWRLIHTAKCLFGAWVYSKNPPAAVSVLWSVWGQKDFTPLLIWFDSIQHHLSSGWFSYKKRFLGYEIDEELIRKL